MKNNRRKFTLSLLAISVLGATSAMAADTDSPFATPVHLSNPGMSKTVTITKSKSTPKVATWNVNQGLVENYEQIKPNIMLYLDNSGSMSGAKEYELKNTMSQVLNKYGDKAYWGLQWMHWNLTGYPVHLTDNWQRVNSGISAMVSSGSTPLLTGYVKAVDAFDKSPIDRSCTNNYLVVLTDGAANDDTLVAINPVLTTSPVWRESGIKKYELREKGTNKVRKPYEFATGGYMESYLGAVPWQHTLGWNSEETKYLDKMFLRQLSEPLAANTGIKTYTIDFGLYPQQSVNFRKYRKKDPAYDHHELERTRYMLKHGAYGTNGYGPNGEQTYFSAGVGTGELFNAFDQMIGEIVSHNKTGDTPISIVEDKPDSSDSDVTEGVTAEGSAFNENKHAIAAPAITGNDAKLFPEETVSLWLPIGDESGLRSAELRFYKPDYAGNNYGIDGIELPVSSTYGKPNYVDYRRSLISHKNGVFPMENDFFGNNDYFALNAYNSISDEWTKALMPWVSRSKTDNAIKALNYTQNTDYRIRKYPMGDILESDIVSVGKLVDNNDTNNFEGRKEFIVAAANDGMAYIFKSNSAQKANNAATPYNLMMTYAPSVLQRQNPDDTLAKHYKDLAKNDYAQTPDNPHLYMLSGGITAHTLHEPFEISYMTGNAGRGAKGLYAMNLSAISESSDTSWKDNVPLFDAGAHRGGSEKEMGYTVGYSATDRFGVNILKKTKSGDLERDVENNIHILTAVGSGFSSKTDLSKQETALYIYDTLGGADVGIEGCGYDKHTSTNNNRNSVSCVGSKSKRGQLITKVSLGNTGGLATPALYDVDLDGIMDYAFAGDYSGNMYRCDVRDYKNVSCSMIFSGSKDRPITSAPIIARLDNGEHVVSWGTGSDMFPDDITETKRQALYGVYQKFDELNNVTKDYKDKTFTEKDLLQQTMTTKSGTWEDGNLWRYVDQDGETSKKMRSTSGDLAYKGWTVELDAKKGERVVVRPMLMLRTVFFSTRVYGKIDSPIANPSDANWDANWTESEWAANGWTTTGWRNLTTGSVVSCSTNDDDIKNGRGGWSPKKLLDEHSTSSTAASNKCSNKYATTTTTTQRYQSTCTEGANQQIKYAKSIDGKVAKQYSALIQLNIATGGNLNKRDASAYMLMGGDRDVATATGYSGDESKSLITSESFIGIVAWMIHDPTRKGLNRDFQGNNYERGDLAKISKKTPYLQRTDRLPRDNNCTPDDGKTKFEAFGQGEDKMYHHPGWAKVDVANCLRRISWRELY